MSIPRKNRLLNEVIAALNEKLRIAKGKVPQAFQLLSPLEMDFVKGEISRCISSRIYYLENYHVIQPEKGTLTTLYPIWDHQHMVEDAVVKERDLTGQCRIIVLKPRQAGITEYANGVMCWCTFLTPNAYTMSVAQAPDVAAHIQRKINLSWDNLPWWMRPERQYHNKGEYLEFNRKDEMARSDDAGLGSVFVTTHAQRESGVAIGRTIRNLHMSEVSRWGSGEIFVGDIDPSMNAPDTMAIAESTALGSDGFYYNLWQEAMEGESDWKPVFLPAYRAKKFSKPIKTTQLPFVLTEIEAATLARVQSEEGFTITPEFFNWRRFRLKAAIKRTGFPYAHYESYPLTAREAFQSSGLCAFPRHKLDELSESTVRKPRWVGEISFQGMHATPKLLLNDLMDPSGTHYYRDIVLEKRETHNRLHMWEKYRPEAAYYLGCDVGGSNAGDDFNVIEVIRAGQGRSPDVQVAEWVGWAPPTEVAKTCYALGKLYGNCEIAVEYAKEGMLAANYLMNDLEYPNLYRPRALDRIGKQFANYMHWQTTGKTKTTIVATMNETLLEDGLVVRSEYLLAEMYKFSRDGQSYSGLGAHDDSVMAACISLYCLRQTMPELRSPAMAADAGSQSPTSSARPSGGAVVYGIYDQWFRLRAQTRDLSKAMESIGANPGWKIKNIIVSKANTAHSIIHHESGPANDLYRSGVDSREISPHMIHLLRSARSGQESDAEHLNDLLAGEMVGMGEGWGGGMLD